MKRTPNDPSTSTPDKISTSAQPDTHELGRDGLLKVLSQRLIDAARTGEALEAKAYLELLDYLQELDWDLEMDDAQRATAVRAARQAMIDELSEALERLHAG
ncbi:hypothetical protein [Candidatus Phycosocius spiralis]|uniref:Uncharacterized protein n=1 Tax=Candidatus Phycosocius spiralis TaxID=2815099 RepID=A0ABQ4PT69_9PROT|nr:hypothetical protein [Candidatus Phycosocius spiralis]GIU66188.1 hypothetical protein PsB1_0342 [Candidatus Phycosocius spiralis]